MTRDHRLGSRHTLTWLCYARHWRVQAQQYKPVQRVVTYLLIFLCKSDLLNVDAKSLQLGEDRCVEIWQHRHGCTDVQPLLPSWHLVRCPNTKRFAVTQCSRYELPFDFRGAVRSSCQETASRPQQRPMEEVWAASHHVSEKCVCSHSRSWCIAMNMSSCACRNCSLCTLEIALSSNIPCGCT